MSYTPNQNPEWFQQDTYLSEGMYITSPSNLFCAILQTDGNFVIYSGTPSNTGVSPWAAASWGSGPPYQLNFQADGNMVEYEGNGNQTWQAGWAQSESGPFFAQVLDDGSLNLFSGWTPPAGAPPLATINAPVSFTPRSVSYDLSQAVIEDLPPIVLFTETLNNSQDSEPQTFTVNFSQSTTQSMSFSSSIAVTLSASLTIPIPFVNTGGITVTASETTTFSINNTVTVEQQWGFDAPVTVPAYTKTVASFSVSQSQVAVPYIATGTFLFASGVQAPGQLAGTFTGLNSYDFQATYSDSSSPLLVGSAAAQAVAARA